MTTDTVARKLRTAPCPLQERDAPPGGARGRAATSTGEQCVIRARLAERTYREAALPNELTVRRETGKEQRVQVPYDEGIANRIGPEPCAGIREDVGEASVGERAGQPSSRDRKLIPGADAVCVAEGNTSKSANASAWTTRRGRRTWHARMLLGREPGDPTSDHRRVVDLVRIGKARSRSR